jgi:hypothetical protein
MGVDKDKGYSKKVSKYFGKTRLALPTLPTLFHNIISQV